MATLKERLTWWLGLNIGLALTPLLFNAFSGAGVGWTTAIGHGELILIAVAVGGLGLAGAARSSPKRGDLRELRAFVVVGGILFVFSSGLVYADNFRAVADGETPAVELKSYVLLGLATGLGAMAEFLLFRVDEEQTR